jgi:hypothetical protein
MISLLIDLPAALLPLLGLRGTQSLGGSAGGKGGKRAREGILVIVMGGGVLLSLRGTTGLTSKQSNFVTALV